MSDNSSRVPDSSRSPDVVVVTYVYPPDNYAGAARPSRLVKYLGRLNYGVRVVAAAPRGECGEKAGVYRVRGEMDHAPRRSLSFFIEKLIRVALLHNDEGITWVPRAVHLVSRWIREGRRGGQLPVIVSTSPPITTHFVGWWLKRRFGCPWIADFRDPLCANPCRDKRVQGSDRIFERSFFRNADAVIANTDAVADLWRERYPQWEQKIRVIWNGFDPDAAVRAAPVPPRPYRLICHVGSLYCGRYPASLISSLARLIAAGKVDSDALRLQLVGPASEARGEDATRSWLQFMPGLLPSGEARRMITEADFLLLADFTIGQRSLQVPAKLFEYLTIGRPILAYTLPNSPVERILQRGGVPYACLYPGQDAANDQKLLDFLALPSDPVESSPWFRQQFDAAAQAGQLASIVETVAGRFTAHAQESR